MQKVYFPQIASTNSWLLDALSSGEQFEEGTVFYTFRQTNGRGQIGNVWESEPDKNIAFSLLLKPDFLPLQRQFLLSEVCSLGVLDALTDLVLTSRAGEGPVSSLSIKWPNDIYWGDEKLGGILIENRLMGSHWSECILGIGLNVNQEHWIGNAPNPTSLSLHGIRISPEKVLDSVCTAILHRYNCLKEQPDVYSIQLHNDFHFHLYRREGRFPYVDAQSGESFLAELDGVDPEGPLSLRLPTGECRRYWFKEVRFVLPCGVTKE